MLQRKKKFTYKVIPLEDLAYNYKALVVLIQSLTNKARIHTVGYFHEQGGQQYTKRN